VLVLLLVDIKPHVDRDMTLRSLPSWPVRLDCFHERKRVRHFFDLFLKAFRISARWV